MKKFKKGFTLIELIVVIALFSMVTSSVYAAFKVTNNISKKVGDLSDLRQRTRLIQKAISEDIKRGKKIVLGTPTVLDSSKYEFADSDCTNYSNYCKLNSYKPEIYIETLAGNKFCYAYDKANKKLMKITSITATSTTTVSYKPTALGNYYYSCAIKDSKKNEYKDYIRNNPIYNDSHTGVFVYYYEEHISEGRVDSFKRIGAFKYGTSYYLVLESTGSYFTGKWFCIPLTKESVTTTTYNAKTEFEADNIIKKNGNDGINITQMTGALSNYYDISIFLNSNDHEDEVRFRTSMIDYGGEIE